MGEQAYVAIAMATRKFMDGTHQLIISRLIVQALFEVPAVCVLRLNGKNDTGAAGPKDLVTFLQHFPKHGGGGTGAGFQRDRCPCSCGSRFLVALGLDTISRTSSKAFHGVQSSCSNGRH